MIRKAHIEDVREIHALLQHFAGQGLLLGRSISSLYDSLRDFVVYDDGGVKGVCALHITWENLAEIRSLAVKENAQKQGIGARLVRRCLADASGFGISRVFTLTYQQEFFRSLGFVTIDKSALPHKIWSDCINCPQFPDCDEEAMMKTVDGTEINPDD